MSKELEIEFKSLVSPTAFKKSLTYFAVSEKQFVTQTNLYFDTADFKLKALGCGLRIRYFSDRAEATLKVPQATGLLEITDSIQLVQIPEIKAHEKFLAAAPEIAEALSQQQIFLTDLTLVGDLTTRRAEFDISLGKLALDESWYADEHDFEIELEVQNTQASQKDFEKLLSTLDIPYQKADNKISRAVSAHLKRKNS